MAAAGITAPPKFRNRFTLDLFNRQRGVGFAIFNVNQPLNGAVVVVLHTLVHEFVRYALPYLK